MENSSLLRMSSARVGAQMGHSCFPDLNALCRWAPSERMNDTERICVQLVCSLAFNMSCTLPFKSYIIFRNCAKPEDEYIIC